MGRVNCSTLPTGSVEAAILGHMASWLPKKKLSQCSETFGEPFKYISTYSVAKFNTTIAPNKASNDSSLVTISNCTS